MWRQKGMMMRYLGKMFQNYFPNLLMSRANWLFGELFQFDSTWLILCSVQLIQIPKIRITQTWGLDLVARHFRWYAIWELHQTSSRFLIIFFRIFQLSVIPWQNLPNWMSQLTTDLLTLYDRKVIILTKMIFILFWL